MCVTVVIVDARPVGNLGKHTSHTTVLLSLSGLTN